MTEIKFPKQYVKVPKTWTVEADDTVTVVWEDRLCTTHQELQTAIKEIGDFQRTTESRKINNATELTNGIGGRKVHSSASQREHTNVVSTSFTK